jgi:four helix bundle protein
LGIATGSSFELETQMIIARNLEFINQNEFEISEKKITEVQKMLHGFKKHISAKKK